MTQYDKNLGYCEEANTYCSVAEERYKEGINDFAEWLKQYKVVPEFALNELIRDFKGEKGINDTIKNQ